MAELRFLLKALGGEAWGASVGRDDPVATLRARAAEMARREPAAVVLIYRGRVLADDAARLGDCGFAEGADPVVHVVLRHPPAAIGTKRVRDKAEPVPDPWRLFVKTMTGKHFAVSLRAADTVADLVERICDLEGVPPPQQRLMCRGFALEEPMVVSDYVAPDETITMTLKLRGD